MFGNNNRPRSKSAISIVSKMPPPDLKKKPATEPSPVPTTTASTAAAPPPLIQLPPPAIQTPQNKAADAPNPSKSEVVKVFTVNCSPKRQVGFFDGVPSSDDKKPATNALDVIAVTSKKPVTAPAKLQEAAAAAANSTAAPTKPTKPRSESFDFNDPEFDEDDPDFTLSSSAPSLNNFS